ANCIAHIEETVKNKPILFALSISAPIRSVPQALIGKLVINLKINKTPPATKVLYKKLIFSRLSMNPINKEPIIHISSNFLAVSAEDSTSYVHKIDIAHMPTKRKLHSEYIESFFLLRTKYR